jgi:hypothetical protein
VTPTPTQPNTPEHVHRRDHRPCPWTLRSPLKPTKAATIWMFRFAEAVRFEDTFAQFVAAWPDEFPTMVTMKVPS